MSYMFEIYYHPPVDAKKEESLALCVGKFGGRLDFREEPAGSDDNGSICLTFEFDRFEQADVAAQALRQRGEHVEGPEEYDREPSHA